MSSLLSRNVRIAVEGCGHGTLNAIYESVTRSSKEKGWDGVDLLIIGGDFQAVRNAADLNAMAVPVKYREIGDFHEYYSGERVAPYLTIFIGGNHEASNYMRELYYGGWAAPNIYYLGAANVVRLGPLRIAGMSGIWKGYDYRKTHFERLPYNKEDVRSVFHTREHDIRKLLQIRTQVDIGLSHDWPAGVEWLGNYQQLFRQKKGFEEDARIGQLGSKAAKYVLDHLRPPYWFSAHLHVKYAAIVEHPQRIADHPPEQSEDILGQNGEAKLVANQDEIELDEDTDDFAQAAIGTLAPAAVDAALRAQLPDSFRKKASPPQMPDPPTTILNSSTRFLALNKCLPGRDFLQLMEIPCHDLTSEDHNLPMQLAYDPEWLAITKVFADNLKVGEINGETPRDLGKSHYAGLIEDAERWVDENIVKTKSNTIPENFAISAPPFEANESIKDPPQPREYSNSQTEAYCKLLDIPNAFFVDDGEGQQRAFLDPRPSQFGDSRGSRGRGGWARGRGGYRGGTRGRDRGSSRYR